MTAAWAWIPVPALPILWVIGWDVWASKTNHWSLSRQMYIWAFNPTVGPIIIALGTGGLTWFVMHILRYHAHP